MAYTPIPAAGGAAVGSPLSGGTASRFVTTDSSGNIATDSDTQFDGTRVGIGVAPDANRRLRAQMESGATYGLSAYTTIAATAATSVAETSDSRAISIQQFMNGAGNTIAGISRDALSLLYATNNLGTMIRNNDAVPIYMVTGDVLRHTITGAGRHLLRLPSTSTDAGLGGVLKTNQTATGNVGAGEDDLHTYTIPASVLAADGDSVWAEFTFSFAANANGKRVRVRYGATALYDSTSLAQNGGSLRVRCEIRRTGAATQEAFAYAIATSSATIPPTVLRSTPTETLSGTVVLKSTGEATSNDDIVCRISKWGWDPANN